MQTEAGNRFLLAVLLASEVALALLAFYLPVLHFPAVLLFPVPVALLTRKYHLAAAFWSLLGILVLLGLVIHPLTALSFILQGGTVGLILGLLFKNGIAPGTSLKIIITVAAVTTLFLLLVIYLAGSAQPFITPEELDAEVERLYELYNDWGLLSEEEQRQVRDNIKSVLQLMLVLVPGSMVIWGMVQAFLSYLLTAAAFRYFGYEAARIPPFSTWQYPWYVIWGAIAGLACLLAGDQWGLNYLANAGKNLLYVTAFLLFVLGLSVFTYFIKRWRVPVVLKGVVVFTVCLYWPLSVGLMLILGLLDPVLNLRKLGMKS